MTRQTLFDLIALFDDRSKTITLTNDVEDMWVEKKISALLSSGKYLSEDVKSWGIREGKLYVQLFRYDLVGGRL